MKKYMAVLELKPGTAAEDMAPFAEVETHKFEQIVINNIDHYYSNNGVPKFWCILTAQSLEEVQSIMYTLPYYEQGLLTIDISELKENKYSKTKI